MKYTPWIGLIIIVAIGAYFFFTNTKALEENANATYEQYDASSVGFEFEYKTSPDGYVVEDLTSLIREQIEGSEVVKVFRVINAREKEELETSEGGREGPPVITIMVFKNLEGQSALGWAEAFPLFSSLSMILGEVDTSMAVGGESAISYRTDGLYQSENIVAVQGDYVYYFNGAFLEENSAIYTDFLDLVASVSFIPSGEHAMPQGKIDPRVACESALIYMTFENGAAADAFVEACVRGEHPEVINRYIEDLGLDGATI